MTATKCCDKYCTRQLSSKDIKTLRSDILTSTCTETQQSQKVVDYLRLHSDTEGRVLFVVGGKSVCKECWRLSCGIKRTRFRRLVKQFESGVLVYEHGRSGGHYLHDSTEAAISWMRSFFDKVGDRLPMQETVHLPACLTKNEVFQLCQDDLTKVDIECCGQSTFYTVWKSEFANVSIPKVSSTVYTQIDIGVYIYIIYTASGQGMTMQLSDKLTSCLTVPILLRQPQFRYLCLKS